MGPLVTNTQRLHTACDKEQIDIEERAPREGRLLRVDGSRHRWSGPDRPFVTLVGAIDDATGRVTGGTFRAAEDSAGHLVTLTRTAAALGLPWTPCSDRHGILHRDPRRPPTLTEQLTGRRGMTQVGRALEVAGIGWWPASSPEAKGEGGAPVGHPPGPPGDRAAPRGHHHDRRC